MEIIKPLSSSNASTDQIVGFKFKYLEVKAMKLKLISTGRSELEMYCFRKQSYLIVANLAAMKFDLFPFRSNGFGLFSILETMECDGFPIKSNTI